MNKMYKKRSEFITAMRLTAIEYVNGTHKFLSSSCHLCTVATSVNNIIDCDICPWRVIAKRTCSYNDTLDVPSRVSELLKWIRIYENGIDYVERPEFKPFTVSLEINTEQQADFWYTLTGRTNDNKVPGSGAIYDQIKEEMEKQELKPYCDSAFRPLGTEEWFKLFKDLEDYQKYK